MKGHSLTDSTLYYFDIAWLSRYDGPGHRVVLYLQGCNLRCPWCHSPHSQIINKPSLLFFPSRCLYCGSCAQVCHNDVHKVTEENHTLCRDKCTGCGKCIDACPVSHRDRISGALAQPAKKITVAELWRLLYPQLDMLRSIGGLTVSGGEALLQSKVLHELLLLCKGDGIHTTVETSGALPQKHFEDIAHLTDCWLYGLRPTPLYNPPHAELITQNLAFLTTTQSRIIIRTPIMSGITDSHTSLAHIAQTMEANRLHEIQLLPFNRETSHYYHALGLECEVGVEAVVEPEHMESIRTFFAKRNILATTIH